MCPGWLRVNDDNLMSCSSLFLLLNQPTFLGLFPVVLVIVFSLLVMLFNIGVPNDLKGSLFFAQVVGFVYRHGSDSDKLHYVNPCNY